MTHIAEKIKKNKLSTVIISTIVALFLYANYSKFNQNISANNKYMINYKQNIDEFDSYREPKIAVLLYNKNKLETIISPKDNYLPFLHKKYGYSDQSIILDPIKEEEQIATIAKAKGTTPKAVELNSENLDKFFVFYDKNNYKTNVTNFIADYKVELLDIITNSLNKNGGKYSPTKKNYPFDMFDKGNSFVYDNKGIEVGSLNNNTGVAQDIANNIYEAKKQGIDKNSINVVLLTKIKRIKYENIEDLYQQILPHKNGLVLRDGFRQAVMLPYMWENHKTIEDFVNALKLKANLLPNYNSNKIKFYIFEVVEI